MQTTATVEKKKISATKELGLQFSPKKASDFFTVMGVNKAAEEALDTIRDKVLALKKKGMEPVPKFTLSAPKRLTKDDEKDKFLKERFESASTIYKAARAEQTQAEKKYESFASEEYKSAVLAYRLKKKLEGLLEIQAPSKDPKHQPNRDKKIAESVNFVKTFKHKTWELGFNHVCPDIHALIDDWRNTSPVILSKLNIDFKATNDLFSEKDAAEGKKIRFGESVRFASAFIVQEAIKDIMKKAITTCAGKMKNTVRIEHFYKHNISKSPFLPLFQDLKSFVALSGHFSRSKAYALDKKRADEARMAAASEEERKSGQKKGTICATFEQVEVNDGFAKVVAGKTKWFDINIVSRKKDESDACVNLTSYVANIFTTVKTASGHKDFHISAIAKEYLSNLICQFLEKLNKQILIFLRKNTKETQKTFDVDSLLTIIQLQLIDKLGDEDVQSLFKGVEEMLGKLKKIRSGPAEQPAEQPPVTN